ncbi:hypothetical protein EH165_08320 [Nakamurella antarctica]|uniref:DUF1023 domain-containing protein n=1 Tax=Nakamurella antarctica TaxID=1902245 RepID=A0A3G8ZLK4_9ACTN|nr:alpha/beta hydrolase [Nakamurella antarctica]AZI58143.1 hypothetical protein EH165_08320 [Nakamurella antarctica]
MAPSIEYLAQNWGFPQLTSDIADLSAPHPTLAAPLIADLKNCSLALQEGVYLCEPALKHLAMGWSAPGPSSSVNKFEWALIGSSSLAGRLARSAASTVESVTSIQNQALATIGHAGTEIARLTDPAPISTLQFICFSNDVPLDAVPRVTQILTNLSQTLATLRASLAQALTELVSAFTETFDAAMAQLPPVAVSAAEPMQQRPSDVDKMLQQRMQADLRSSDPWRQSFAATAEAALDKAEVQAGSSMLLVYRPTDPSPQGGLAIGLGDIDHAEHVLVTTGGVGTGPKSVAGTIDHVDRVLENAASLDPNDTTAAIIYQGYDAPWAKEFDMDIDIASIVMAGPLAPFVAAEQVGVVYVAEEILQTLSPENVALQGQKMASELTPILNSLPVDADVLLELHSWGSVVGSTAVLYGMPADGVIHVGSPGTGMVTSAATSRIDPANQWVMANKNDPVAHEDSWRKAFAKGLGIPALGAVEVLGPNPADPLYGARLLPTSDESFGAHGLDTYMTPAAEANEAAILTEQFSIVIEQPR